MPPTRHNSRRSRPMGDHSGPVANFKPAMKRHLLTVFAWLAVLSVSFLLVMRYWVVAREGYPAWEAVGNLLMGGGEIVVILPEGVKVISAQCDDPHGRISVEGQAVITKIGYSWCRITVETEVAGRAGTIEFNPQKLNNWNRIRFEPHDAADPQLEFAKFENGIRKSHSDVSRRPAGQGRSIVAPDSL